MNLIQIVEQIAAEANKPGVMSLAGRAMEKKMAKQLEPYFRHVAALARQNLKHLANVELKSARHAVDLAIGRVIRITSHALQAIIERNWHEALLKADKQKHMAHHFKESFQEADDEPGDVGETILDLPSEEAARIAKEHAAKAVVGINKQTIKLFQDAVEKAIKEQSAPQGLSQLLRQVEEDMVKSRADTIARTEMSDAFGEASLQRLNRGGIKYKQLIPSPGACEICLGIVANGPVPIDEPFVDDDDEEYDRSPIHPNCRCATVGANAPDE